ncbi:MAG TPA: aminopeptidase P family protein, partial [Clostridia bacterium]|nr:aminopeptidase P family protein [Clostridia bacterium]
TVHMTGTLSEHSQVAYSLLAPEERVLAFEDDHVTVSQMRALEAAMPDVRFVPMAQRPETLRAIKDEDEIASITKACEISCLAFEHMLGAIKPGQTETEIRLELETALYRFGADKLAFDTIIAGGANGSLPHAVPGSYRVQKGDFITMDFGARVNGYCSDMTRTVALGAIDTDKRRVYDTVLTAQLRALDALKPGALCKAVDAVARDYIYESGFEGRFGHGLGHCLGLDIHESPRLSMSAGDAVLMPGHVITVEPGIYRPGQDGVRIEDTCLITASGHRRLTPATKELIFL